MTSSIPTVKAALVTVLQAALPATQVIYGPLSAVTTTGPRVLTVGRVVGTRSADALDMGTAAESYTVELVCSADLTGTNQQSADEAVLADYVAGEHAIRADITLGLPGTVSVVPFGEIELVEQADENGRHAAVRWSVSVYAQTT